MRVGLWRRLSAEELVLLNCGWRRLLRVPWTARRSNQSILKEISPGISLKGVMLKLKLQYFGHLMQRVDSLEKTLMLGGIGGRRRRADRLDGHEFEWTPRVGDGQGGLACCDSWGSKESDTTERLNWTELNWEQYPASQVALVVKNLHVNAGDTRDEGSIPRWGKIPWRRAWQPTPVFLPGESHGWRSLVGPKGHKVGHDWSNLACTVQYCWVFGYTFMPWSLLGFCGSSYPLQISRGSSLGIESQFTDQFPNYSMERTSSTNTE